MFQQPIIYPVEYSRIYLEQENEGKKKRKKEARESERVRMQSRGIRFGTHENQSPKLF